MTEVEFYSDGTRIAAELFLPPGLGVPAPAVVVAHGFGGIKAFFVADIARAIAAAGFACVTFDYRGFGESDGPRNRLHPLEQVEDALAAAAYLRTRDEVDPERVGVYGTSFGGGIAIAAAALDPKMRAAVCAVGISDCGHWLRSLRRNWEWIEFQHLLEKDRRNRLLTGVSEVVEPEVIMVRDPESEKHEQYLRENWPDRAFQLDLASADAIMAFRSVDYAKRLGDKALLLVGVDEDGLTSYDYTVELYEAATGPKKLIELSGMTHHDIYQPQERDGLMAKVVEFLKEHVA
ncbi:alpha/beta hydrolase [Rhodococcus jostii]|uniref:alpha/beta hydrolase n=1 Tax=Rhodococcus jostii TaxID=132919 RepID=UPI00142F2C2B|nr:alpha/beta hydrolase [Rhodococcus jostii]